MYIVPKQKHALSLKKFYSLEYIFDFRNFIRGHYYDGTHTKTMRRQIADSLQLPLAYPWANQAIADYYFHLPPQEKYNLKTHTNKLLVRKMLKKYLNHEEAEKRGFEFDVSQFLLKNKSFVKQEILECKLWNKNISVFLNKTWEALNKNSRVERTLNTIFLISGWHNHSKYLR